MGLTGFNRARREALLKQKTVSSSSESKVTKTVDAVKPEEKKEEPTESAPKKGKKTNSEPLF